MEAPAVDTIINFRTEEAAVRSARCGRCHEGVRTGGHAPEKVACNDCHARTNPEAFHGLRAGQAGAPIQARTCRRCHQRLPASHEVEPKRHEGCTGCHRAVHRAPQGRALQE